MNEKINLLTIDYQEDFCSPNAKQDTNIPLLFPWPSHCLIGTNMNSILPVSESLTIKTNDKICPDNEK
jgi:nicotinamidase-related amidase